MLASTADSAQFWRIGQNWPCYLARPFHALFARISCNTFLESLKHANQPWVGFVAGSWVWTKYNCSSLWNWGCIHGYKFLFSESFDRPRGTDCCWKLCQDELRKVSLLALNGRKTMRYPQWKRALLQEHCIQYRHSLHFQLFWSTCFEFPANFFQFRNSKTSYKYINYLIRRHL